MLLVLASVAAWIASAQSVAERPTVASRIVAGPTLLAADLEDQWGGHTFSYLLAGERALFWSALAYQGEEEPGVPLVGSFPSAGEDTAPVRTTLPVDPADLRRTFQPLLVRTPDGFVHAFVGYTAGETEQGRVAYFRSERSEDVGVMLSRGDVPLGDFVGLHVRQNVAVDPTGERMVLVTQSSFAPGVHEINIPLICYGRRKGADFVFTPPSAYREALPVFYPSVAALERDVVVVGQDHDADDRQRNARLFHLDWAGNLLAEQALPHPDADGTFTVHALAPASLEDRRRLRLVRSLVPDEGTVRWIEFWEYDVERRALTLARSVRNDFSTEASITNAGELLSRPGAGPVFLNNPASGALASWDGDVFGTGSYRVHPWSRTDPRASGLVRTRSVFAPSPLSGSVLRADTIHLAADVVLPGVDPGARGSSGLLLWELAWGAE